MTRAAFLRRLLVLGFFPAILAGVVGEKPRRAPIPRLWDPKIMYAQTDPLQ